MDNLLKLYILARFTYRVGSPIITDAQYSDVENKLIDAGIDIGEYLARTYDDDPIPYELLKEFNLEHLIPKDVADLSDVKIQSLTEDRTQSIRPVESYREAFEWFQKVLGWDIVMSLKGDGVNLKVLFDLLGVDISLTRGRNGGTPFNVTKNVKKICPAVSNFDGFVVFGECFVKRKNLEYLRNKYGKDFKTSKSTAISMLRVEVDPEDYSLLEFYTFKSTKHFNTLLEMKDDLRNSGFNTMPYLLVKGDYPTEFEPFCSWLKNYMTAFSEIGEKLGLPSDGLVCEINDQSKFLEMGGKNQYSNGNIALKFENWGIKYFKGKVVRFIQEQQAENISLVAEIEPLELDDGCIARRVNVYNPAMVIEHGINIGSEIYFERKSNTDSVLLYGKRLESMLKDGIYFENNK